MVAQYDGPTIIYSNHVPEGMRPCWMCCADQSGCEVGPGIFRDTDCDFGESRFPVCGACAGTGVNIGLTVEETQRIWDYRSARNVLAGQILLLTKELLHAQALITAENALVRLEYVQQQLQTGKVDPESLINVLSWLFADRCDDSSARSIINLQERIVADCHEMSGPQQILSIIQQLLPAIEALFPDKQPLPEEALSLLRMMVAKKQEEKEKLEGRYHRSVTYEECMLLLEVHRHWDACGRPKGTYAEDLVHSFRGNLKVPSRRRSFSFDELMAFSPDPSKPQPDGLTAQLLAELDEATRTCGRPDHHEGIARLNCGVDASEFFVSARLDVSSESQWHSMIVFGPDGMTSEGAFVFYTGTLNKSRLIIWDKRTTKEHVQAGLLEIDTQSESVPQHFIEAIFGGLPHKVEAPRHAVYEVEKIFAAQGTCMPVFPGGPCAEELRDQFDHPESVMIFEDLPGERCLCHIRDKEYLKYRRVLTMQILERRGLRSLEDAEKLPLEEITAIREEVDRAMPSA